MAGRIKRLIENLIEQRTQGEAALIAPTKIKLIMKGVDPDLFDDDSPDDPVIIQKIAAIADEMGFDLK